MVTKTAESRQAKSYEELAPLVELCKNGRLFEVQEWIAAGKPLDPPSAQNRRSRKMSPLEYAMDRGFHSLVEVLLRGGASAEGDEGFCPMSLALARRRLDLVQLLVEHGFDPADVDVEEMFATWDPEIMEYFIERGADVETDMPLAWALCSRIRTSLRILKRYRERFPSFQEQANVALRHHCMKRNLKWVSLMLWAGADPLAPGSPDPDAVDDPDDEGMSALGYAALMGHFDVFSLKKVKLPIDHPAMRDVLRYSCKDRGIEVVQRLLSRGMNPNDQENGGCSAIQHLLAMLEWGGFSLYGWERRGGIDTSESRERIKAIHLLAKHGARWRPVDTYEINAARRSLLKMTADYTVEFVWIMAKHRACSKSDIRILLRTPTIKRHTEKHRKRLAELVSDWPEDDAEALSAD